MGTCLLYQVIQAHDRRHRDTTNDPQEPTLQKVMQQTHRVIPNTMHYLFTLAILLLSAFTTAQKVAGGAALGDVVPMQKVKKPKLNDPLYVHILL